MTSSSQCRLVTTVIGSIFVSILSAASMADSPSDVEQYTLLDCYSSESESFPTEIGLQLSVPHGFKVSSIDGEQTLNLHKVHQDAFGREVEYTAAKIWSEELDETQLSALKSLDADHKLGPDYSIRFTEVTVLQNKKIYVVAVVLDRTALMFRSDHPIRVDDVLACLSTG